MDKLFAISVIIPMYNAEQYIAECLDSLLNQTFQDFEVIIINDSSNDSSRAIAESYIPKFGERLKIFDNEKNFGQGYSRNNGLRYATGEYVFFMDADDMLLLSGLEKMYAVTKYADKVDVVNLTKYYAWDDVKQNCVLVNPKISISVQELLIENNLKWRIENLLEDKFMWKIWCRLLRRDFLLENEIFFPEDIEFGEDQIWTHGILFCAEKTVHLPYACYLYRRSKNSITLKERNTLQIITVRLGVVINGLKWIDDIIRKNAFLNKNLQLRHEILDHFTRRFYAWILMHANKKSQTEIYGAIKREFGDNFGEYDVLISALCTYATKNQKEINNLKKKLNITS